MPEKIEHVKDAVMTNAPTVIYTSGGATVGFSFVDLMTSIQTYAWAITLLICILTFILNFYFKYREDKRKEQSHRISMAERFVKMNAQADGPITEEFVRKIAQCDEYDLELKCKTEIPDSKK